MPSTLDVPSPGAAAQAVTQSVAYWPLPLARAAVAAVLAVTITFSADHSAQLGLLAFGAFATISGLVLLVLTVLRLRGTAVRDALAVQGVVSLAIGITALVARPAELGTLLVLLGSWSAATGLLELYAGFRARRRHVASADLIAVGAITLVAAIVFALLPPDLADSFVNADGTRGVLDSAVVAVGVMGAYAAITAVFLAIAGFSARWAGRVTRLPGSPDELRPAPRGTDA